MDEQRLHPDTLCVQAGYRPGNGAPRVMPICQSTTYRYESAARLGDLFDLAAEGHMYTRISNPTVACVEEKIAALEGGVGALCTSSGQAATMLAVLNLAGAGQNIVSLSSIYGGTVNLFAVTLKKLGVEVRFASQAHTDAQLDALFDENTRLVFGETIANPALTVLDIRRMSALAHRHGVPLVVDNTFATPILCRPFDFGADIVVHSTSKYMDGHAAVLGGAIVDGGRFDWAAAGRYPELTGPDESYHGVVYAERFGRRAYIEKARAQLMRDKGATIIFSTHNMSSVEEICDHITLINKSRNILSGEVDEIRRRHGSNIFEVAYRGEEQTLRQAVAGRCEILDGTQEESVYRTLKLHVESDADVRGVSSAVNDAVELRSFREIIPSMNDIFIRAVNGSL